MGWGIQNRNNKKWVNAVRMVGEGYPKCSLVERDEMGIWTRSESDAFEFMREHWIAQETYRPVQYNVDKRKVWFSEHEYELLSQGWTKKGYNVFDPEGNKYY